MVKQLDAINIYEIAESGNIGSRSTKRHILALSFNTVSKKLPKRIGFRNWYDVEKICVFVLYLK